MNPANEFLRLQAIKDTMDAVVEEYNDNGLHVTDELTEEEWIAIVSERSIELMAKRLFQIEVQAS
jgi:hypothetical protein